MKTIFHLILLGAVSMLFATQSMAQAPEYGYAIYYADYFQGKRTANGEIYDKYALTCAHKVHPFGTLLKVTRTDNFKSVVVRVNDRGPYNPGCVVDLSWAAADQIGLLLDGKVEVKVEVVSSSVSASTAKQQESYAQLTVKSAPQAYSAPSYVPEQAVPQSYNSYSSSAALIENKNVQNIRVPIDIPAKGAPKTAQPAAAVPADVPVAYSAFPEQMTASATPRGAAAPAPVAQKGYSIQVGSYSYQGNADRQAQMIRDKGVQNVQVRKTNGPSGSFYKILVGSFGSKTEASNFLPKLKNQYGLAGYVVNLANM